jgi:hypothetical protein
MPIFDPAIFDPAIFDTGAQKPIIQAGAVVGIYTRNRKPKPRKRLTPELLKVLQTILEYKLSESALKGEKELN